MATGATRHLGLAGPAGNVIKKGDPFSINICYRGANICRAGWVAENETDLTGELAILYREYPYYDFSTEVLYRNREFIQSVLNPVRGLQAYLEGDASGTLGLRLGNIQILPVEVLGVEFDGSKML